MPWRFFSNARVDPSSPAAAAQCDRCDQTWNHNALRWELQWMGTTIRRTGFLVCPHCYDVPAAFLRAIIIPPDPVPIPNPRVNHNQQQMNNFSPATTWDELNARWDSSGGSGTPTYWNP